MPFLATYLLSCMIYMLRRKPCKRPLPRMQDSRCCTSSGMTSVTPCCSIRISKIHPFLPSKSSKSTGTGSDMPSTPNAEWTDLEKNQFLRHGGRLPQPPYWMAYPTPETPLTPKPTSAWTITSTDSSKLMGLKNPQSSGKTPPP